MLIASGMFVNVGLYVNTVSMHTSDAMEFTDLTFPDIVSELE